MQVQSCCFVYPPAFCYSRCRAVKGAYRAVYTEEGRSSKAGQLFVGFTCRNFGPCNAQVEKELKTAGDKHKNVI